MYEIKELTWYRTDRLSYNAYVFYGGYEIVESDGIVNVTRTIGNDVIYLAMKVMTIDEAKEICVKHHESLIKSFLVKV